MSDEYGSYCCFWCPAHDNSRKKLDSNCPTCGRPYSFPLKNAPNTIGEFSVEKALGRGFYGATFVVNKGGILPKKHVLKLIPVDVYSYFKKDFLAECRSHAEVASGASFITRIDNAFDEVISFGDGELNCHVAVLEYLDGELLSEYLSGKQALTAATACQIASDLFRIRDELESHEANHNDFHAGNIIVQRLPKFQRRESAMEPGIKAIAIDLGSLAPDRRSGGDYKGDLHWMAEHIDRMATLILSGEEEISDIEARVSLRLRSVAQGIAPSAELQRTPNSSEIIQQIEEAFHQASEPWKPWAGAFWLKKFNDGYNAQTLEAWNVPRLLVDPGDQWRQAISASGPLVITGMRGCGKTMLLRALQFHARAVHWEGDTRQKVFERLKQDDFVGFFVSASALLSIQKVDAQETDRMFARLLVAYALELSRSLSHLKDINPDAVSTEAVSLVKESLNQLLNRTPDLDNVVTLHQLERKLVMLFAEVCRSDSNISLVVHPGQAFPMLAEKIRACAEIWNERQVLFLLDDVSTRYLQKNQIEEILSALIFQDPKCAFKLTSESQTIFLVLRSPGGVEPASHGRDFATFDLGAEVHDKLKDNNRGRAFLSEILHQRARVFAPHPKHVSPDMILGDNSLNDIAWTIASKGRTSKDRKNVYHGISALRAVCVGDLGTAITIYDSILARVKSGQVPVSAEDQANAFQNMCSVMLYRLDRRNTQFRSVAKSFAAASHKLLLQSAVGGSSARLRQYASIYVRVTSGDQEKQLRQLRELVDAGVFVFQNGAARTKTKDSDPTHQFKLTFRRIYGLADYMGLSERDRFELSGSQLEEWLDNPERGEELLTRNLNSMKSPEGPSDPNYGADEQIPSEAQSSTAGLGVQGEMFGIDECEASEPANDQSPAYSLIVPKFEEVQGLQGDVDVLYLAMGFEDRALASVNASMRIVRPSKVVAIGYEQQAGRAEDIRKVLADYGATLEEVGYQDFMKRKGDQFQGRSAIDVTGMTKALIFRTVFEVLKRQDQLIAIYTEAETYFPQEAELNEVICAAEDDDQATLLSKLKNILTGEAPPYENELLYNMESDGTRMNALFAQGSAKHERLIHLIDSRDYSYVKVLVDDAKSARATVARRAAEVAVINSGSIEECDIADPAAVMQSLKSAYELLYMSEGLNFEIGLTGDKIEAIAASAFVARTPVNRVFYVKPAQFDPNRFSLGHGNTRCFRISY